MYAMNRHSRVTAASERLSISSEVDPSMSSSMAGMLPLNTALMDPPFILELLSC